MNEPGELGDDGKRVPISVDARAWARDWIKTIKQIPSIPNDEDTMVTWFASAIMAGYDRGKYDYAIGIKER